MLHGVTWCYSVLHGVTVCYMKLDGVIHDVGCNTVLRGVTWCYWVLQCVTRCYSVLHGVTRCYTGLQCVTACYRVLKQLSTPDISPPSIVLSLALLQLVLKRFVYIPLHFLSLSKTPYEAGLT